MLVGNACGWALNDYRSICLPSAHGGDHPFFRASSRAFCRPGAARGAMVRAKRFRRASASVIAERFRALRPLSVALCAARHRPYCEGDEGWVKMRFSNAGGVSASAASGAAGDSSWPGTVQRCLGAGAGVVLWAGRGALSRGHRWGQGQTAASALTPPGDSLFCCVSQILVVDLLSRGGPGDDLVYGSQGITVVGEPP
jgi:hypothetical protein